MSANRTLIFISSSAQLALKKARQSIFDFLESLGHQPVMFEENFGMWPTYQSNTAKCLEKVRECDVCLLFISDKAGTYIESADATVTYLEFLEAIKTQKTLLVFVKDEIVSMYFSQVKRLMDKQIACYQEAHQRKPSSIFKDIVQPLAEQLPTDVDPYTWVFLHDLYQRDLYFEQFSEGVSVQEKLAEILSDLLRQGARLLPLKEQIDSLPTPEHLDDVDELRDTLFHFMKIAPFRKQDWQKILPVLRKKMRDDVVISHVRGELFKEPIAQTLGCRAISLYEYQGQNMMARVAKDGNLRGKDFYLLDADHESYVVQAYQMPDDDKPRLWYREDKKMVYFVIRSGIYVMCMHFLLDKKLPHDVVAQHTDDFIRGIMAEQGDFIDLVQLVLGGMKHATP